MAEALWALVEGWVETVFESGRIKHLTKTGMEIIWADVPIRPAGLSKANKRYFARYYDQVMEQVATSSGLDLIGTMFALALFRHEEMRYSPLAAYYPWVTVRIWVSPLDESALAQVDEFIQLMLPARCIPWFQLLQYDDTGGFGVSPFGHFF